MNSVSEIASSCLLSYPIWEILTLTFGQGYRHLDYHMQPIGLYLGAEYEVCGTHRF